MTKKNLLIAMILLCGAGFLLSAPAFGGTISMSSSMKSTEVDGRPGLEVKVWNDGDEAARGVLIHVEMAGDKQDGPKWELLNPKEPQSAVFFFENLPAKPGTYPVYITIEFADLNMYPFTALNIGALQAGRKATPAQIFAKADRLEFSKTGTLSISLKNLEDKAKSITARVVGPRELNINPMLFDIELGPKSAIDRKIEISNFSALPGAGYPIFVVFEYDQGDFHYTHPLVANVKIAQGGLSTSSLAFIIAFGGVLLAAVVSFEVFRRLKNRKKARPAPPSPIEP